MQVTQSTLPPLKRVIIPKDLTVYRRRQNLLAVRDLAEFNGLKTLYKAIFKAQADLASSDALPIFAVTLADFSPERLIHHASWETSLPIFMQSLLSALTNDSLHTALQTWYDLPAPQRLTHFQKLAHQILQRETLTGEAAVQAHFVFAALQVYCRHFATQLQDDQLPQAVDKHHCPVCQSAPQSSGILLMQNGLRYLHCELCETEWHFVRSLCHECDHTGKLQLLSLEEAAKGLKAESCENCYTYIKWFDYNHLIDADPIIEDMSSLSLDVILAEQGYQRIQPFFMR